MSSGTPKKKRSSAHSSRSGTPDIGGLGLEGDDSASLTSLPPIDLGPGVGGGGGQTDVDVAPPKRARRDDYASSRRYAPYATSGALRFTAEDDDDEDAPVSAAAAVAPRAASPFQFPDRYSLPRLDMSAARPTESDVSSPSYGLPPRSSSQRRRGSHSTHQPAMVVEHGQHSTSAVTSPSSSEHLRRSGYAGGGTAADSSELRLHRPLKSTYLSGFPPPGSTLRVPWRPTEPAMARPISFAPEMEDASMSSRLFGSSSIPSAAAAAAAGQLRRADTDPFAWGITKEDLVKWSKTPSTEAYTNLKNHASAITRTLSRSKKLMSADDMRICEMLGTYANKPDLVRKLAAFHGLERYMRCREKLQVSDITRLINESDPIAGYIQDPYTYEFLYEPYQATTVNQGPLLVDELHVLQNNNDIGASQRPGRLLTNSIRATKYKDLMSVYMLQNIGYSVDMVLADFIRDAMVHYSIVEMMRQQTLTQRRYEAERVLLKFQLQHTYLLEVGYAHNVPVNGTIQTRISLTPILRDPRAAQMSTEPTARAPSQNFSCVLEAGKDYYLDAGETDEFDLQRIRDRRSMRSSPRIDASSVPTNLIASLPLLYWCPAEDGSPIVLWQMLILSFLSAGVLQLAQVVYDTKDFESDTTRMRSWSKKATPMDETPIVTLLFQQRSRMVMNQQDLITTLQEIPSTRPGFPAVAEARSLMSASQPDVSRAVSMYYQTYTTTEPSTPPSARRSVSAPEGPSGFFGRILHSIPFGSWTRTSPKK